MLGPVRSHAVLSSGACAVASRDLRRPSRQRGQAAASGTAGRAQALHLGYANEHRPWALYRSVFYQLLGRCREVAGSHGFRFKNKLLTLDATLIELCASVFDWAQYRRTKGAVKLHLLLDHQGLLPSFALITEGRVHESRVARSLRFEPGTIVVFDRGYADYDWFASLDADGEEAVDQGGPSETGKPAARSLGQPSPAGVARAARSTRSFDRGVEPGGDQRSGKPLHSGLFNAAGWGRAAGPKSQ
jgi:Transposase DDE domain